MRISAVIVVAILVAILSRPSMNKLLRGLLASPKELALFAVFMLAAMSAATLFIIAVGPLAGFCVLIVAVGVFVIWAMRPPAKPR